MTLAAQFDRNFKIAEGDIPTESPFNGIGEVDGANGDNIDMWLGGTAIQPEPVPAGFQPNLISSSVEDNPSGTGVGSVDVHYLDTSGNPQMEVVITDGTTLVNMVATDVMFIQDPHTTPGAVGSLTVAAGNIDIRNVTTVMGRIPAAGNRSLSSMRQVPFGKKLLVDCWRAGAVSAPGGQFARIRLRATIDADGNDSDGVYLFTEPTIVKDSNTGLLLIKRPLVLPALSTIKVTVWSTGAMDCTASWFGVLKDA